MSRRRIPPATWREAKQRWVKGELASAIAASIGVSQAAIYWRRRDEAWPQRQPVLDRAKDWERAKVMWQNGVSVKVIAKAIHAGSESIYNRARLDGWGHRRHPNTREEQWAGARLRWDAGESVADVARVLGLSEARIRQYARLHDWPRRERPKFERADVGGRVQPRIPRAAVKFKGHPCLCGSLLSRLTPLNGVYVYRCSSCQPVMDQGRCA